MFDYLCSMGMEPETFGFLVKIANSIAYVLIWMLLNVFFGIYLDWGFFEGSPGWKNILYYIVSLTALFFLIRKLVRKWSS